MPDPTPPTVGEPQVLATYADRNIVAQRVDGVVQVRDEPATGDGRSYLIEPTVDRLAELDALVGDYRALAARLLDIPMKRCWF